MAAALEGVSGQQHAPASLYPRERPGNPVQEAGWAPGPVWWGGNLVHTDIRSRTVQLVAQSLYWLSHPAHIKILLLINYLIKIDET